MRGARSALVLAAFSSALLFPARALAQESGFYLGGALGQAKFTEWCVDAPTVLACDDKTTAWKILGGYRFNRHLALEASYIDWGEVDGSVLVSGTPRRVTAEQTSIGVAAVGSLPLGQQVSLFGKAGFLMTEQETPAASVREREETEFHYGLGAQFHFTPNWGARAEWERTDKLKVEMFSLGLEFRF